MHLTKAKTQILKDCALWADHVVSVSVEYVAICMVQ